MIASLLLLTESLFSGRLVAAARAVHIAALAFFLLLGLLPPLGFAWRRWRARRRAPRIPFWRCACGQPNPMDAQMCGKCAARLVLAWEEKWAASAGARALSRAGMAWRAGGWALYYGCPLAVFLLLDGHRFGGGALRELFSALGLLAALGAVVLAGAALGRDGGGAVTRCVLLLAAGTFSGFFLASAALWAAAPFPPLQPLASVSLFSDGRVLLKTADGAVVQSRGRLREDGVEFRVRSALLSWPLMHIRQTVPVALGESPLGKAWVTDLLDKGSRRFKADGPHLLRISIREDILFDPPGGPYVLRSDSDGAGLLLEPPAEKS